MHYLKSWLFLITMMFLFYTEAQSTEYYWDSSTTAAYQTGNGTWSTSVSRWTLSGGTASPVAWPGSSGHTAIFTNQSEIPYTVTVSQQPIVDSIVFKLSGCTISGDSLLLQNKRFITVDSGTVATVSSKLVASGLKKNGTGTLILSAQNRFTDTLKVLAGTLKVTNSSAPGIDTLQRISIASGASFDIGGMQLNRFVHGVSINGTKNDTIGAIVNSGALQIRALRKITLEGPASIGGNGSYRFDLGRDFTSSVCIDGKGFKLNKIGTNEISILGTAANLDTVEILGGTLLQENIDALDTAYIYIGKNGTLSSYNTITLKNRIAVGGGTIKSSMHMHTTTYDQRISIIDSAFFRNDTTNTTIIDTGLSDTCVSGTGKLIKTGKGKLILAGKIAHTGGTEIRGGVVQLGNNGTTGSLTGNVLNNDSLVFLFSGSHNFTGNISGNGRIVKRGLSHLTLTGNNASFTGKTIIESGAVNVGQAGTLGSLSGNIINNDTLRFNRGDTLMYSDSMTGSGIVYKWGAGVLVLTGHHACTDTFRLETGTLQIGNNGTTGSFAGHMTGDSILVFNRSDNYTHSGSIGGSIKTIKRGAGTVILSGVNTTTGTTSVTTGTLLVNGSLGSANTVSVSRNARIGGSGTCNGTVTLIDSSIISPGSSATPGKFTVNQITMTDKSILELDVGTKNDTLHIAGSGVSTVRGKVHINDTTGIIPGIFTIATFAGSLADTSVKLSLSNAPEGFTFAFGLSGKSIQLTIAVKVNGTAPAIQSVFPADTSVYIGNPFSFTVAATGSPDITYEWRKSGVSAAVTTSATFSRKEAAISDSGVYTCTVSNPFGTITSSAIHLSVKHYKPKPQFSISQKSGSAPLQVTFTDASVGDITSRLWSFGDDSSSTHISPVHTYTTPGLYTVKLTTTGSGGTDSLVKKDSVFVYKSGDNPVRISGRIISGGNLEITLSDLDKIDTLSPTPEADSIGIWYKERQMPKGVSDGLQIFSVKRSSFAAKTYIDTISLPKTDSAFGLMSAIFWNDKTISPFTPANGTMITVKDTVLHENIITLDTLFLDTATGSIRVRWCVDSTLAENKDLEVAISYSLSRYPLEVGSSQTVTLLSTCTDTIVKLTEPLRFDTLYRVALWLRQSEGIWLDHTVLSRDTLRIGKPSLIQVKLFDPDKKFDTIPVFNDNVILWKDPTFNEKTSPVVTIRIPEVATTPEGTILAGTPILFVNPEQVLPFFIGITVTNLPKNKSIKDVRLYADSAGTLRVLAETVVDSAHNRVYVKTSNLEHVILPLLDTLTPVVAQVNKYVLPYVLGTESLTDTISIKDNIVNTRYSYYFGRGNELPVVHTSGELDTKDGKVILTIPDSTHIISSEFGFRAFLVVTDDVHTDTLYLSRSVLRSESDPITTSGGMWTPISPTATLLDENPAGMVDRLLSKNEAAGYDPRYLRFFRWISYDGNRDSTNKWVEYDPENETTKDLFSLQPGKLLWLKTRENIVLHLDSSYTLSLQDSFSIDLPPGEWTDFGMPYRFSVPLSEVFAATGSSAESIDFCVWKQDESTGLHRLEPLYIADVPDHQDENALLEFRSKGGYSFYNHSKKTVKLRIPPTIPEMVSGAAKVAFAKKSSSPSTWGIRIASKTSDNEILPELYTGYSSGCAKRVGPPAPSFSSVNPCLFDRSSGTSCSYRIDEANLSGIMEEIVFRGSLQKPSSVTITAEEKGSVPSGYVTVFYNASLIPQGSVTTIDIPKNGTVSVWMVTGTTEYHAAFTARFASLRYSLQAPYPNPARHSVTIRYSVPLGSGKTIYLSVYNLNGKLVWCKTINGMHTPGMNSISWNGKDQHGSLVSSGMYLLRLDVLNDKGRPENNFKQRITFIR